eukprot:g39310.t1
MNQKIHSLLKTRCVAFKSGDLGQHRKSRYDLRKAIREAKRHPDTPIRSVTASEVRLVFLGVNSRKVMDTDSGPSRALRSCVDQLAEVFTYIFNLSFLQPKIPTCFKKDTIIPIPKKAHAVCLNDYHLIALTSIIMKCFERLVMAHIN